jgi:catechol 2,3-dioxygenase-like lactoylglutathione lyase family enzyme
MSDRKEERMDIKVQHIGILVKDLDKTVEMLKDLGIRNWKPLSDKVTTDKWYRGRAANYRLKIAVASVGPVEIELLQHMEGECVQKEVLERQGEGIYHFGYFVDDFEKEVSELKAKGFEPVQSGKKGSGGFCYLEAGVGNILLEPIQRDDTPDMYEADPEWYSRIEEVKKK